MKDLKRFIVGAALVCAMGLMMKGTEAKAATNIPADIGTYSTITTDYGADGSDNLNDAPAFYSALSDGKTATADNPKIIFVPAGTYYLESPLDIYSHTTIIMDDNAKVITRYGASDTTSYTLYGKHLQDNGWSTCLGKSSGCTHGGHSQIEDIHFIGGTWEGCSNKATSTSIFVLRHGNNITMDNMTFKGSTNHMVNLSGSANIKMNRVHFEDQVEMNANVVKDFNPAFVEAVHLDFMSEEGEGSDSDMSNAYPYDDTPAENVEFTYCSFNNVNAGIGSHHENTKKISKDISVKNCTFAALHGNAIDVYSGDRITISDNHIEGGGAYGINVRYSDHVLCENNMITEVSRADDNNGIRTMYSKVSLINNTIENTNGTGIWSYGDQLVADGNTVKNSSNSAITYYNATNTRIINNKIETTGIHGIYSIDSASTVDNNTIDGTIYHGIQIENGTATVTNNSTKNNKIYGIHFVGTTNSKAQSNTIDSPESHAVCVEDCKTISVLSNIIKKAGSTGIFVKKSTAATLSENTISNSFNNAIHCVDSAMTIHKNTIDVVTNYHGIKIENGTASITNNNIKKATFYGIHCNGLKSLKVQSNIITSSGNHGICLDKCGTSSVVSNVVTSPGSSGIYAKDSKGVTISSNGVTSPTNHGIYSNNSTVIINGNTIKNAATYHGIQLEDGSATVSGNTVENSKGFGIHGNNVASLKITNNNVTTTESHGIYVENSNGAAVTGNKVQNAGKCGIYANIVKTITISGNTITNAGKNGIVMAGEEGKTSTGTIASNNVSIGADASNEIRLQDFCENVVVNNNTLAKGLFSAASGVVFVGNITSTGASSLKPAPALKNPVCVKNGIQLNWDKVTGVACYRIYRKTGSEKYQSIGETTDLTYTDKMVTAGKAYTYKIVGISSTKTSITSKFSAEKTGVYVKTTKLSSVKNVKKQKAKVKWKKAAGVDGYVIQYSQKPNFSKAKKVVIKKGKTTSTTIKKLAKFKKYYVRICTYKTVAKKKYYSDWSAKKTVTIKK